MKKQLKNYVLYGFLLLSGLSLMVLSSCNEDDDEPDAPVASFQFAMSETNFLEVTFTNFSQNATTYAWEFGDGETSADESPVHTYAEAGSYDVTLTASNDAGESATRTQTVQISDPDAELTKLAGLESKTWILQRQEVALSIGPAAGADDWWSFGGVTPLGDRPCILDDEYTFTRDGAFEFNSNGTLFMDGPGNGGWTENAGDVCNDEATADFTSTSGLDMSAFKSGGDYTYTMAQGKLTLSGAGVYIGLANKTNTGDLGDNPPQEMLEYEIVALVDNDDVDSLKIALPINGGDGGYWNFYLVHYDDESLKPNIPSAEPRAAFSFAAASLTVTFTNSSANASTYAWDFGDGNSSTEENPTHTYAAEGTYTVTLTATDASGTSASTFQDITVTEAVYSADIWSAEGGKTWTLAPVAGAFRVGPAAGSGEWFGNDEAAVTARDCLFDDEFTFGADGSFSIDLLGQFWSEPYSGNDGESCVDVSALPAPFDGLGAGTDYAFSTTAATETERATVTVTGSGAYIGFAKPHNNGEYAGDETALETEITYQVFSYFNDGTTEQVEVTIEFASGAWWTMKMQAK